MELNNSVIMINIKIYFHLISFVFFSFVDSYIDLLVVMLINKLLQYIGIFMFFASSLGEGLKKL